MSPTPPLPSGVHVLERGWLSANNVLFDGPEGATLVDSGYCSHADQTVALVDATLGGRPLARLINTHLHSDHCGGNAALQARHPGLRTWVPAAEVGAVTTWDAAALSFVRTGQTCPRFACDGGLAPGDTLTLAQRPWRVLAAPGHDPHALLLFQADTRVLLSGDALWDNGFGVVFPELEGQAAFSEVADTLDLIEDLRPVTVVPGHGPVFGGTAERVDQALARARSRLAQFQAEPTKHTLYAAKVLLKFKLMEFQRARHEAFMDWAQSTPYVRGLHGQLRGVGSIEAWLHGLLADLERAGAAQLVDGWVLDR